MCACAIAIAVIGGALRGADEAASNPAPTFQKYCFTCHGNGAAMGGMRIDQLLAKGAIGESFAQWDKVATALTERRMPPKGMPQPADAERAQLIAWIRAGLADYAKKHDGEPGRVTVRRLTSGEYGYAIHDLTGLDIDTGIDAATDSVGGEGFTNFGDVQFMQDANLERYLEAAKKIADHAVIGSGPIEFFTEPGKSGFEMSAIHRIKEIYTEQGFRTVSGEGGFPYGLEKYNQVFFATWRYRNRAALGEAGATLESIAAQEGVSATFARHIWSVMNDASAGYPVAEMAARWRKLPAPTSDRKASIAAAHAACEELQKSVTGWFPWLFGRGDQAVGGAGDESPLIINDKSLSVQATHHFVFNRFNRGGRGPAPAGPAKIFLNVVAVNPSASGKPVVIWKNATIGFRTGPGRGAAPTADAQPEGGAGAAAAVAAAARGRGATGPKLPLRSVVSDETAKRLAFGTSPDGTPIGENDFAAEPSAWFEVPVPQGVFSFEFQADAVMGAGRDQVFRITITDREDGTSRGIPIRSLLGDPQSAGYRTFKAGALQMEKLLPPNSQFEPTPADKDPVPDPFDSTYNVPEHDEFDTTVKYIRDDRFIYRNMLDDALRTRVDHAWNDLYTSFEYHNNYLKLLAQHFGFDLKGKHIGEIGDPQIAAMPAEMRPFVIPIRDGYVSAQRAESEARPRHVTDCLEFASRAWRRPLTESEKQSLRTFYDKTLTAEKDHRKAIRALLARILVSPAFLYRVEQPVTPAAAVVKPLSGWQMASRLSFLIWSSVPDEELRRAATAGELNDPKQLERQTARMLADPKARRLATEFFGQWLGFYHFDQLRGVDTTRFPEFTDEVRSSMYDEAVSFFEHIVRQDRPVREILFADYTFLNGALAKFYGVKAAVKPSGPVEMVEGANALGRGGLLRLGAVLTATSAPLRTSPVKRGDWVLRRVLGIAVPPPPADAGSIPADDKMFGGLSVKQKLEAHKRNATCANCHARIDPLGFPLEHYDSIGRWREHYTDGKPVDDVAVTSDQKQLAGVAGLLEYLDGQQERVRRTLARKLVGYALGRTVQPSDQALVDRMAASEKFSQLVDQIVVSDQFRKIEGDSGRATLARADAIRSGR
jgi:hypothetical protein